MQPCGYNRGAPSQPGHGPQAAQQRDCGS